MPVTRSSCSVDTTGPTSVSASAGSPKGIWLTSSWRAATTASWTLGPATTPARGRAVLPGVVVAGSAHPGRDGRGVGIVEHDDRRLAAGSRCTRLRLSDAALATALPAATEPVSDTIATSGCDTRATPAVSPWPHTTLSTPGGKTSAASSARRSAV